MNSLTKKEVILWTRNQYLHVLTRKGYPKNVNVNVKLDREAKMTLRRKWCQSRRNPPQIETPFEMRESKRSLQEVKTLLHKMFLSLIRIKKEEAPRTPTTAAMTTLAKSNSKKVETNLWKTMLEMMRCSPGEKALTTTQRELLFRPRDLNWTADKWTVTVSGGRGLRVQRVRKWRRLGRRRRKVEIREKEPRVIGENNERNWKTCLEF